MKQTRNRGKNAHLSLNTAVPPEFNELLTLELATPFSKELVEALKVNIAFRLRAWDETAKVWRINPTCQAMVERICRDHYLDIFVHEGDTTTCRRTGRTWTQKSLF